MTDFKNLRQDVLSSLRTASPDHRVAHQVAKAVSGTTTKDELVRELTAAVMFLSRSLEANIDDNRHRTTVYHYRRLAIQSMRTGDPRLRRVEQSSTFVDLVKALAEEPKR